MLRPLVLACLVTSTASAAPGPRALHLVPEDDKSAHHLFAAEHDTDFPAISDDGSTLAQLYQEGEDFTGAPITTLVLWKKDGTRLATFRLGGYTNANRPPDQAGKIAAYEWPILAAANTQLSRHRWNPAPVGKPCGKNHDDPSNALCFPDGVIVRFDAEMDAVSIEVGKRKPQRLVTMFQAPGIGENGGACGVTRGLEDGFGSRALGFVIVDQTASLGGDSCVGQPTSDSALTVFVP